MRRMPAGGKLSFIRKLKFFGPGGLNFQFLYVTIALPFLGNEYETKNEKRRFMMIRTKRVSRSFKIWACFLLSFMFFYGIGQAKGGGSNFKYKGFVNGEAVEGKANFHFMERINIWRLAVGKYQKSPRESFSVNIFFSRNFQPKAGTFPIAFSYLNKENTCGGSFSFRQKDGKRGLFSHDTKGELTFETFSEMVKGTFQMEVGDGKGKKVEVSGSFELELGDAFKK
jgi:hypothetical protein